MSNKDARFKQLFSAIKDAREMKLMHLLLTRLVNVTYRVTDSELQSLFSPTRC